MELIECIGSQNFQKLTQFRAKPGADLLMAIKKAAKAEGIRAGVIVSGLGALKKAAFRNLKRFPESYPVTPEDRLYLEVERPMELVSLVGWIAPRNSGDVEVHAHFSVSTVENDKILTLGGHLTEGTMCGIKVVVSILVLTDDNVYADEDAATKSFDIFFKKLPN
jgi:predicted DNA-binding protein with PD1-like motif